MKIYFTFACALLFILGLAGFLSALNPAAAFEDFQTIAVPKGAGFAELGDSLSELGIIRSRPAFVFYALISGSASGLKAGEYSLSPSQSAPEIIRQLYNGPGADLDFLVKEGATIEEIDAQLSSRGILRQKELLYFSWEKLKIEYEFLKDAKSLEGFLFPDTYRFHGGMSPERVARLMLDNFRAKAMPVFKNQPILKTLIIASIIEKEVPFHNDRLLVSGIIQKRLKIGMPLQVDAAPETYDRLGLPATPISNPGLDAIQTALSPKASNYLYYLSDPKTQKTIFSVDFEEHKLNKFRYLGR